MTACPFSALSAFGRLLPSPDAYTGSLYPWTLIEDQPFLLTVLNCSPSPPQQYARSKNQDAAEDREEPCAVATGVGESDARFVADNNYQLIFVI